MNILEAVRSGWAWTGLQPEAIVDMNAFGNVIVRAGDGRYWRITPEETQEGAH